MRDKSPALRVLLAERLTRRRLLAGGAEVAVWSLAVAGLPKAASAGQALAFKPVVASTLDAVVVPDDYIADVLVRWGDPLFPGVGALDPKSVARGALLDHGAAADQARQFGYNCDGLGIVALDDDRALLCVNHEFPSPELLFPGWTEARQKRALGEFVRRHPAVVDYMQMAVGLSVVEIERRGRWRYKVSSPYNRRLTAKTPFELAGPASRHRLLNPRGEAAAIVLGTFNNCSAGTTPWGTYLTAEENTDDFFGNGAAAALDEATAAAHRRFGLRQRDSAYRWEYADARFDSAKNPLESLKFGWIVELDPKAPGSRPKKRTALGRFKHESATTVLAADGRAVAYMGDDEQFEYLYKFVSRGRFDPERPAANADLLDDGTLFVAKFSADGRGEWLPLVHGAHPELTPERGFASQADIVLRCREAADRLGATPLDRPEDIAVHPRNGNVYVACTQNLARGSGIGEANGREIDSSADAVSPRSPNTAGHIVEIAEQGADAAAASFRWEIFVLAGAPRAGGLLTALPASAEPRLTADATYFAGVGDAAELSAFANPDNLGFDRDGNLWIVTDGAQPNKNNNGCFVCATEGPERGAVRQFMSGPAGAEISGCEFTADDRTLVLSVQHPGAGGGALAPTSHWPDGADTAPRPSVVAIERKTPGPRFAG
jgi:secreted PhoX family phosphatase